MGRASGGMLVFHKNQHKIIEQNTHWIFSKMRMSNKEELIIGFLYLSPSYEYEELLTNLQSTLHNILENEPESPLIIIGDFNARIGNLNQGDEEQFINAYQSHYRSSLDSVQNRNGKLLVEMLEIEGLFVVNGRSYSDSPASYTFISKNGKSTIDFAWANLEGLQLIKDLKICDDFHQSDHLPASLTLDLYIEKENEKIAEPEQVIRWRAEYKENLQKQLANIETMELNYDTFKNTLWQVAFENNMVNYRKGTSTTYKKKWFDNNCYRKRKEVRSSLRLCKRNNFKNELLEDYLTKKKNYVETLRNCKTNYEKLIQDKLKAVKDSKDFWKTINMFLHKKKIPTNKISIEVWETFHNNYYKPEEIDKTMFYDPIHPYMDDRITKLEVYRSIKGLKNGKTPGPDGITNEILKHLPENWVLQLTNILNKWFENESLPKDLSKGKLVMIHKKGDDSDPTNYRGIALLNTSLKIFTQIIANRISSWAECFNIFHENQSGFRKQRSCTDNIFVLSSIIQERLYNKRKQTYAIFVDFKKAFDSVNHQKLWQKLFISGISGRMCRMIRNIYNDATLIVQDNNVTSRPIKITKGVLQGDPLSALLFSLFINDIENFFRERELTGISLTPTENIILLLYADDLVILADSPVDIQRKLDALEKYAKNNNLEINTEKTKILLFHIGRPPSASNRQFWYQQTPIDKTNTYSYLGTTFVSSGLHNQTVKERISKANLTSANLRRVMCQANMNSWEGKLKMFNSMVIPTALYASEVWGLQHLEEIEKVGTTHFKNLFNLQKTTPNYIVRRETGQQKLAVNILKQTLRWWYKVLKMKNTRYPKILYNVLLKSCTECTRGKQNWAYRLKSILCNINLEHVWTEQNPQILKDIEEDILVTYEQYLYDIDSERINKSTYNTMYKDLTDAETTKRILRIENHQTTKVLAQLRTANTKRPTLYIQGKKHVFDTESPCDICNTIKPDDMFHFFFECPLLTLHRNKYLNQFPPSDRDSFHRSLYNPTSIEQATAVCNFVTNALKTRTFAKEG